MDISDSITPVMTQFVEDLEQKKPNLVAISFQEIVQLCLTNMICSAITQNEFDATIKIVHERFFQRHGYQIVKVNDKLSSRNFGNILVLFKHNDFKTDINTFEFNKNIGSLCGLQHCMPNKNAQGICLKGKDVNGCIINVHMEAHAGKQYHNQRNGDFKEIFDKLKKEMANYDNLKEWSNLDFLVIQGDMNMHFAGNDQQDPNTETPVIPEWTQPDVRADWMKKDPFNCLQTNYEECDKIFNGGKYDKSNLNWTYSDDVATELKKLHEPTGLVNIEPTFKYKIMELPKVRDDKQLTATGSKRRFNAWTDRILIHNLEGEYKEVPAPYTDHNALMVDLTKS